MGYYQGDMYRGDFFGAVGKIFSGVRRIASPVFSALGGVVSHPSAAAGSAIASVASRALPMARKVGTEMLSHPVLSAAGIASAAGAAGHMMGGHPAALAAAGGMPRGFHMSRKSGRIVKNRRMRATNPKALRRALRRAYAFERLAMRTIHLVHPRKKGRFGGFKRHRRKAA